jgi:hypothetical protein
MQTNSEVETFSISLIEWFNHTFPHIQFMHGAMAPCRPKIGLKENNNFQTVSKFGDG